MRAITLDQPLAWAFCHGKLLENRGWPPPLQRGEPVAIHAGLTPRSLVELWDDDVGMWHWPNARPMPPPPDRFLPAIHRGQLIPGAVDQVMEAGDPAAVRGAVVAVATFDRIVTGKLPPTSGQADWRADTKYDAWLFSESCPLLVPVPCAGKQKLWRLSDAVHEAVEEQWYRALL